MRSSPGPGWGMGRSTSTRRWPISWRTRARCDMMLGKSACLEATSCHGLNMMLMGFILSSFVSELQPQSADDPCPLPAKGCFPSLTVRKPWHRELINSD